MVFFGAAVAINLFCLVATWHPMPYWDHWETVAEYRRFLAHGLDWTWLVAQHNEHRIVFSNLLNLADYQFFGGLGLFLILVNVAVSCASVYLLCRYSGARRLGLTGVSALLFYLAVGTSVTQIANLAWPFQTAWYIALAFAILSFRAYQHVLAGRPSDPPSIGWLLAAWALAAAASFSIANGLMTWIALLLLGALMRYPRRVQLGTLIAGLLVIALYLRGYHAPPHHPTPSLALHNPLGLLGYVAIYATNAIQRIGRVPQLVLGGAIVVFLLVELFRALVQPREALDRDRIFPLSVATFLLGTIAMTALGRLALGGPSQANSTRYATYGLFLLLSATLLLAWRPEGPGPRRLTLLVQLGVVVALITWSGLEGPPLREVRSLKWTKLQVALCDQAHLCPDDVLRRVYPDPQAVRDRAQFLREHRLAQFAPLVAMVPPRAALDSVLDMETLPDCAGCIDGVSRMSDGRFEVRGWMTWPGSNRELPEAVSIYSRAGERLGGGGVCEPRLDIQRALHVPLPGPFRAYGYRAWAGEISGSFYVVGFFGSGTRRCRLASYTAL